MYSETSLQDGFLKRNATQFMKVTVMAYKVVKPILL